MVHDEQGGVLPGVVVTLRNQETGVTRPRRPRPTGATAFRRWRRGATRCGRSCPGSPPSKRADLTVTIGLELTQDLGMKIQSVAETVTVKGECAGCRHDEVRGVGGRDAAADRDAADQLTPVPVARAARAGHRARRDAIVFPTVNIGGSLTFNSTTNLVDGMYNVMVEDGEPRQSLPEDAVQEFKVSSAQYNAEFGLATGGVAAGRDQVGDATRVHGTAFEYFRDKSLNAQGVFEAAKPDFRRNQFGGSVGGPIVRDRMHFFATAERTRHRSVLHRDHRSAAVLLVGRGHVQAAADHESLSRTLRLADQQLAEPVRAVRAGRGVPDLSGLRRHDRIDQPATTRTCRAARWSSPTRGSGARAS